MTYLRDKKQVSRYLDPAVVGKLQNMELKARLIVEGYIAGLHRSPYHGFSVEFAEYRQYAPGDDLRHLDWKAYGRCDRLYLKKFHSETNLACHVVLDTSASMSYGEPAKCTLSSSRFSTASCGARVLCRRVAGARWRTGSCARETCFSCRASSTKPISTVGPQHLA